MSFPSVTFAAFFLCVLAAHGLLIDRQRSWKIAMVAASAVFYGWSMIRSVPKLLVVGPQTHSAANVAVRAQAASGTRRSAA